MGEAMTIDDLKFIHRWEPRRPGAPTLLLLHGTGGTENDLIDVGRRLLPKANLLSPRGQVSENGMARYFRRVSEGVFDLEDLHGRTKELSQFVGDAAAVYGFDPAKVVAVGFSNGANIAASLLLSGAAVLAGAVLLHPMVPFEPAKGPNLTQVAVFVGAGRADPLVPVVLTESLVGLLKAGGAAVETYWQPGGHKLTRDELEAATAWAQKGDQTWN
jgi:phospholipase/carboxylesterase